MEISEFIGAYLDNGNTVLLEKAGYIDATNVNRWLGMFAPLEGAAIPGEEGPTEPGQSIKDALAKPGTPVLSQPPPAEGAKADSKPKETTVRYAPMEGAGGPVPTPQSGVFNFSKPEWDLLKAEYDKPNGKEEAQRNANTDETDSQTKEQLNAQVMKQANVEADAAAERVNDILKGMGYTAEDGLKIRNMFRQVCGGGLGGALQRAARAKADAAIKTSQPHQFDDAKSPTGVSKEEGTELGAERAALCMEDIKHIEKTTMRIIEIKKELDAGGEGLTPTDRKFLTDCFRLRGQRDSKRKGIYMVPDDSSGEFCGGPLAAAAVDYQEGGERYGVQINNEKGPLYDIMVQIHDNSLKDTSPLYGMNGRDSKGRVKPAVFWGGTDAAKANSYRAMAGVMNEYGPKLSKAWMDCNYKQPCKGLQVELQNMINEENFDINLLIWGAEERNGGNIPDSQFANINEIGTELILDQIQADLGGEIDGPKALAWFTANILNMWDPLVSDPQFKGCDFTVVGRGPTGQIKDGKHMGGRVNQDIEISCPGKEISHLEYFEEDGKYRVNTGDGSYGTDEDKNRDHYQAEERPDGQVGANLKVAQGGKTVQTGKTGTAVIDAVETDPDTGDITGWSPDTRAARNRALNNIETVAKNHGGEFTEEMAQQADDYKMGEIEFSHNTMAAITTLGTGTMNEVVRSQMAAMGYEELGPFEELFQKHIKEFQNAKAGSPAEEKARKRIETALTQSYRNKHKNDPGFRTNLAIESLQTGSASQNQLFILTEPGGDTYIGTEADAINKQIMHDTMGYGNPDGPGEIKVTATSTMCDENELTRRVKDGSKVSEFRCSSKKAKENMRNMSGGKTARGVNPQVKESAMKAEDFVRQLQELIKRIDKVQTVKN